jgi:hypothetical protein
METWKRIKRKKVTVLKELVDLQKRKKVESYVSHESVVNHLQRQSKWVLIAFIFDLLHYNIYPLFAEGQQLYIYDATQSIAFLFYIYAIHKLIPKELMLMHFVTGAWLWFSVGDVFNVVYNADALQDLRFENWCLLLNVFMFSYKFNDELLLRYRIYMCWFKLVLI